VSSANDVLERNVRMLLRRSYVPALPAPPYRDRLEALFLAEVERGAPSAVRTRRAPRHAVRWAVALAAGLLALLLGWRLVAGPGRVDRTTLLARGDVALGLPDGSWRAASAEELARGLEYHGPSLSAATPLDAGLTIRVASGELRLDPDSHLAVATHEQAIEALLEAGHATWRAGESDRPLEPGVPARLEAPAEAQPLVTDAADSNGAREPVPGAPEAPAAVADATAVAPARVLTGRVVVATTKEPIARFTVGLLRERIGNETYPPAVRTFEGRGDGTFVWEAPPKGKQRIFVHAEGYALASLGELDLGASTSVVAELEPGLAVRGVVVDENGAPVAGALVISEADAPTDGLFFADAELAFWLPIQTRSAPDGRFQLEHLTPRSHVLRVTAPGLAPAWVPNVAAVPGGPGPELLVRMIRGGTVEGRVTDATGGPEVGMELVVIAMDQTERARMSFAVTRTDADGTYRVEHLPLETMIVVLLRDEDRPDVRPIEVRPDAVVRADFVAPHSGARLRGRLLDAAGAPVALQNLGLFRRRTATWTQDWVASTTDESGSFLFEGVEPDAYQIFLIDEMGSGLRCVDEFDVPAWPEMVHDVTLPDGRLEVRVHDARAGAPVPRAAVMLLRIDGSETDFAAHAESDEQGRCTFTDLRAGNYVAAVYPSTPGLGYALSDEHAVDGASAGPVEVALPEGGAVVVRVTDPAGRPLTGAIVRFRDEANEEHVFGRMPTTDEQGRYRAQGLLPGTWSAYAELDGHRGTPATFRLELGVEREIALVLTPERKP